MPMMKATTSAIRRPLRKNQQGFKLLELMVVLVIICSLLGMVTVTYQVDDEEEMLQKTGQSLRLFLQHQIDQAWMDGHTTGAKVSFQGIEILSFNLQDETWQATELVWQSEDDEVDVSLLISDHGDTDEKEGEASGQSDLTREVDLAFVSSGEYTPFEIQIAMREPTQNSLSYLLTGDGVNALTLKEN